MPRYMLSVIHPDGSPSVHGEVDIDQVMAAVGHLNERLVAEDRLVFATGLTAAADARTVTLDDQRTTTIITDGPFAEAKEVVGGFWVVRADEHEIDALAREAALACQTTIEVRRLEDEPAGDGGDDG